MSYEKIIILYCIYKMNGERTIYSILHLLKGKKSSQTIQDIHVFQLTSLFQTYPSLTREHLNEIVQQLVEEEWIIEVVENYYVINKTKKMEVESLWIEKPFPDYLKGWDFHPFTTAFWEKLSLFVQVVAHLSEQSVSYIPIQRNPLIQAWLKRTLLSIPLKKKELNKQLYEELITCLEGSSLDPQILINRLTGWNKVGLTAEQTSILLQKEKFEYQIQFLSLLHYMMDTILLDKNKYLLLSYMIDWDQNHYTLTTSTAKTLALLNKGMSIEEISSIRRLKISTIEDHLIEILLNVPDYSAEFFVDQKKIERIKNCMEKSSSKSLRIIKEQLKDVSYFEIRVVLSRYGDL